MAYAPPTYEKDKYEWEVEKTYGDVVGKNGVDRTFAFEGGFNDNGTGYQKFKKTTDKKMTGAYGLTLTDPIVKKHLKPEHLIRGMSDQEARKIASERYAVGEKEMRYFIPNFEEQPDEVQELLFDLDYNMGLTSLMGFPKFQKAIMNGDYGQAAEELKYTDGEKKTKLSDYYKDTGRRAKWNYNLLKSMGTKEAIETRHNEQKEKEDSRKLLMNKYSIRDPRHPFHDRKRSAMETLAGVSAIVKSVFPLLWIEAGVSGAGTKIQEGAGGMEILKAIPENLRDHAKSIVQDLAFAGGKNIPPEEKAYAKGFSDIWGNYYKALTGEEAPVWYTASVGMAQLMGLSLASPEFKAMASKGAKALNKETLRRGGQLAKGKADDIILAMQNHRDTIKMLRGEEKGFVNMMVKRGFAKTEAKQLGAQLKRGIKEPIGGSGKIDVGLQRIYGGMVDRPVAVGKVVKPITIKPTVPKPVIAKPTVTEPLIPKPTAVKPLVPKPTIAPVASTAEILAQKTEKEALLKPEKKEDVSVDPLAEEAKKYDTVEEFVSKKLFQGISEKFDQKRIKSAYVSAQQGKFKLGTVSDFIKDKQLRDRFKEVLNIPVFSNNDLFSDNPARLVSFGGDIKLRKAQEKAGTPSSIIEVGPAILSGEGAESNFIHEVIHAKRNFLGRVMGGVSEKSAESGASFLKEQTKQQLTDIYSKAHEGEKPIYKQPKAGGMMYELSPQERKAVDKMNPESMEIITLNRDIDVKDQFGNIKHYKTGEDIAVYQDPNTGKALVKDGDYGVLSKKGVEQVEQAGKVLGEEKMDLKEVVKGGEKTITELPEGYTVARDRASKGREFQIIPPGQKHGRPFTYYDQYRGLYPTPEEAKQAALEEINRQTTSTKYASYQLPGGENYREILVQAPSKVDALKGVVGMPQEAKDYKSSHWDEPNVVTQIRMNDRTTPDGKKILFVEELQSDWAREGRKKGFAEDKTIVRYKKDDIWQEKSFNVGKEAEDFFDKLPEDTPCVLNPIKTKGIPFHPALKNWQEQALKKVLDEAVKGKYDGIAWTTGEQQADRYDLSKQIETIRYNKENKHLTAWKKHPSDDQYQEAEIDEIVEPEKLELYIGKDVAKKIVEGTPTLDGYVELRGEDLKIGGEWAKNLYDKQIPNILKKLTKGEISTVNILEGHTSKFGKGGGQQALMLTPIMKRQIMGQPMAGGKAIKKPEVDIEKNDLDVVNEVAEKWFTDKEERIFKAQTNKARLQRKITEAVEKETPKKLRKAQARLYDKAIQIYIDTKRDPESIDRNYDKLTQQQRNIVHASQNLPEDIKAIADDIAKRYETIGTEALDLGVIKNTLDNYAGRVWDLPSGKIFPTEKFRKFGTKTKHAKKRVIPTIIDGWGLRTKEYPEGLTLKVQGATTNLQILEEEISKTIADKQFIEHLKTVKLDKDTPLITTKHLDGYSKINHPSFRVTKYAGKVEKGELYGKNQFITPDGDVFTQAEVYAPDFFAKKLNQTLESSKLKGIPFIDFVTKYNAVFKSIILQTSLFHHFAFARSYYLGTHGKKWKDMNLRQAFKEGNKMIEQEEPLILHGVKHGLTLGVKQDWDEELLRQESKLDKVLAKNKVSKVTRDKIVQFREEQADFLFNVVGAGLKAKAFILEYNHYIKKHPNDNPDEVAKAVAQLINNDFGGLNLDRLHFRSSFRNATVQHIFRLLCLAADWTESNVRTVVDMFKGLDGDKGEGSRTEQDILSHISRRFWRGVIWKGLAATTLANLLMATMDEDDTETKGTIQRFLRNYRVAWKTGRLLFLDIDITPLYKMTPGEKDEDRRYFSVLGHFKDPLKFVLHPVRSAKHKASVLIGSMFNAVNGTDWAGRRYTTIKEIIGQDKEKGRYKTSRKGKYKKGDPKWGRLKGQSVTWSGGKGAIEPEQVPSFLTAEAKGKLPVQCQQLLGWLTGELDAFDAVANALGTGVKRGYRKKEQKKSKKKKRKKIIYR